MKECSFFIDYFAYGTDLLTDWIALQLLETKHDTFNRFYKTVQVTPAGTIQALPRIKSLQAFSVRLTKERLSDIFEYQLPIDTKIQRIDFAVDVPTFEKAFEFVINKPKKDAKKKYSSLVDSGTGTTFYYTSEVRQPEGLTTEQKEQAAKKARSGVIFERVYQKEDRGGMWRYELEFKPRAGRKHNVFKKANAQIQALYNEVLENCTMPGSFRKEEFENLCITQKQRNYIEIHTLSEFVPITHLFYVSLSPLERTYMQKFVNLNRDNDRCQKWDDVIREYNSLQYFRMLINEQ